MVREAVSELALRKLSMSNQHRCRKRLMIDVDGLPAQVHGQLGSEYHGFKAGRRAPKLESSDYKGPKAV